jgi:hypothetical protein
LVSFTPWSLYPQGKSPWFPLDKRLGGPQSHSGCNGEEKNSKPPPGIEILPVAFGIKFTIYITAESDAEMVTLRIFSCYSRIFLARCYFCKDTKVSFLDIFHLSGTWLASRHFTVNSCWYWKTSSLRSENKALKASASLEIYTEVKIEVEVFWIMTLLSGVIGYNCVGGPHSLHHHEMLWPSKM